MSDRSMKWTAWAIVTGAVTAFAIDLGIPLFLCVIGLTVAWLAVVWAICALAVLYDT